MNDMASTRKMGPLVPCGLREESAGLAAASTGLAVAETEGDFGVFFVEGKRRFYQEKSFEFRVSRPECTQKVPRARGVKADRLAFTKVRYAPRGQYTVLQAPASSLRCARFQHNVFKVNFAGTVPFTYVAPKAPARAYHRPTPFWTDNGDSKMTRINKAARHSRLAPTLEAIGARFVCRLLRTREDAS